MARHFTQQKLVIASHNPGKVREIGELLAPFGADVISAGDLGLPEPEETGLTFVANAELKAQASMEGSGLAALSDDSGLCVNALGGDPGLYSARWAGPSKDFSIAIAAVHEKLQGFDDKSAYFICVLALAWPDGHLESFEGRVYGDLVWPPRGDKGFGYDPMFLPDGYDVTFGEMDYDEKQRISHRAVAFQKLIDGCFKKP
jgi:XTP/dITP diphosphohydrolase